MDPGSGVVIWRVRRSPHFVTCVAEQVGEECFELRILDGHELIHSESFDEPPQMLRRAELLRSRFEAKNEKDTGFRSGAHARS